MASEKMLDHMTEQNNPTPRTAHLAVSPLVSMPVVRRTMMTALNKASIRWGLASPRKKTTRRIRSNNP